MRIIDGHIHMFKKVDGMNLHGPFVGCGYGKVFNNGAEMPFTLPYAKETTFPVEMLLETLDRYGISKAVIFQNPVIGLVNDEVGQALLRYPERLTGVAQVDPFAEDAAQQAEALLRKYPFCALKYEISTAWGWTGVYMDREFHYSMLEDQICVAEKYGKAVVFDTGGTDSKAYLVEELEELIVKHPKVTFVIEHGGLLTPDGDWDRWEQMTDLLKYENVYTGLSSIASFLECEYPCEEALKVIRRLYEKAGADKLIWGTDGPATFKVYTYQQMIEFMTKHIDYLSEEEWDKIFYANAQKVYFS